MPYDNALPNDTSYYATQDRAGCCSITMDIDGVSTNFGIGAYSSSLKEKNGTSITLAPWTFFAAADMASTILEGDIAWEYKSNNSATAISYTLQYIDANDMDYMIVGSTVDTTTPYARLGGSSTVFTPYGGSHSGDHDLSFILGPHTVALAMDNDSGASDWGACAAANFGDTELTVTLDSAREDDIDLVYVASANVATEQVATPRYEDALNAAAWGSSVDILGDAVFVGAVGARGVSDKSRVAIYDLQDANYGHWTATVGGYTQSPLRPDYHLVDTTGDLGADVSALVGGSSGLLRLFAGDPVSNEVRVIAESTADNWAESATLLKAAANASQFGNAQAIVAQANRVLIGATGGSGQIRLFDRTGTDLAQSLQAFTFDSSSNSMLVDTNPALNFGAGGQLISEGFRLAGTANQTTAANRVHNFRQRGPAWNSLSTNDLVVPQEVPPAQAGTSVAMGNGIAVVGAPDYDDRGAAFVFAWSDTSNSWQLQATLQANGIVTGDRFGASVSLDGDSLIVGAPGRQGGDGAVYMFQKLGASWTQKSMFAGTTGETLGTSVDLFGTLAVAGAPGNDAAYIYAYNGTSWTADQTIDVTGTPLSLGQFVHRSPSTRTLWWWDRPLPPPRTAAPQYTPWPVRPGVSRRRCPPVRRRPENSARPWTSTATWWSSEIRRTTAAAVPCMYMTRMSAGRAPCGSPPRCSVPATSSARRSRSTTTSW